ncbi:MAG: RNase adapter RapZ [Actinomycetota bacterium]|nr:RNase adapter RapZ [Actinomycetota bacterium]
MGPEVVIITGLSGAGRTTAAKVLEDVGFFVIDNLPPALMGGVIELATAPGSSVERVALVVDVRGREFFGDLRASLETLTERKVSPRVLFLEAGDDELVRRYEAARRTHPLAGRGRVVDGIANERRLLTDLRAAADLVVDTTDLNVHELRDRIVDAFASSSTEGMSVNVVSFGFKNGTPRDADMVLDVRFLPNPHWVEDLRPLTGLDGPVRDYVLRRPETVEYLRRVGALLDLTVPAFVKEGKRYLTIAVGCTGGRHRSVVIGEALADHIRGLGVEVRVDHRDQARE